MGSTLCYENYFLHPVEWGTFQVILIKGLTVLLCSSVSVLPHMKWVRLGINHDYAGKVKGKNKPLGPNYSCFTCLFFHLRFCTTTYKHTNGQRTNLAVPECWDIAGTGSLVRLPLIIVSMPLCTDSLSSRCVFYVFDIWNSFVCVAFLNGGGRQCPSDRWDTMTTKLVLLLCNHEACTSGFNCAYRIHGQMVRTQKVVE